MRQTVRYFVRPTIEQQKYYGEFTKTARSTSPAAINTSYAVSWDNTEIANGVSIVSGSQLTVVQSGLYQFDVTLQLQSNSGIGQKCHLLVQEERSEYCEHGADHHRLRQFCIHSNLAV